MIRDLQVSRNGCEKYKKQSLYPIIDTGTLAGMPYVKLGERVSFSVAVMINLASLGTLILLVWLGLKLSFAHSFAIILPLLFQIVINPDNLAFWQLAGRILNFQQAKRLFPL